MKKYTIVSLVLLASLFGTPLYGGLASLVDGLRIVNVVMLPFVPAVVNFVAAGPVLDRLAAGQTNEDIAREYPHAYEYISGELAKVGLDPASIRIINHKKEFNFNFKSVNAMDFYFLFGRTREPVFVRMLSCAASFSCIGDKGLLVPLVEFEKELSLASTPGAESDILKAIKVALAHEISHLIHRDGCGMAGFVSGSLVSTIAEGVGACFFDAGTSLLSSVVRYAAVKLLHSYLIDRSCCAYESRADEEALERFSSQPSHLLAQAKTFALSYAMLAGQLFDKHPSDLARAVRFATAAGKSVTEEILSERLKTATDEEILSGAVFE